jgi:hypothetical protein
MSLKDNDWWLPFVSRLQEESLDNLCLEFGLIEEAVIPELVEESRTSAITDAVWWPEARRQIEAGNSHRSVARRFGTHTRRLRKGLARSGARSGRAVPESTRAASSTAGVTARDGTNGRRSLGIQTHSRSTDALPPDADGGAGVASPLQRLSTRQGGRGTETRRPLSTSRLPPLGVDPTPEPQGKRRRRGRLRLVRPDDIDDRAPDPPPPRRAPRKPKVSPHSEVRVIAPDALDLSELILAPEVPVAVAPKNDKPAAPVAVALVPPTEPAKVASAQAPPIPAAVIPAAVIPAAVIPAAVIPVVAPLPARPKPPQAAVPKVTPAAMRTGVAWRVRIDGSEQSMVVVAEDILKATELFVEQLGREALRSADIYSTPLL